MTPGAALRRQQRSRGLSELLPECVADSDLPGRLRGEYCDLNSSYPANALQPPIVNTGFEHCGKVLTDCRIDGGPRCAGNNEFCDPTNGACATNPGTCVNDQDCVGLISPSNPYLPEPFCVNGSCNSCAGGVCPAAFCTSDADCGNPKSLPSGLTCDVSIYQCSCSDSSQCGGFWPVCENLDGKRTNDAGQILGTCGCDLNDECQDAGLICLPQNTSTPNTPPSCGIPCTSPQFQACSASTDLYPICDPVTGVCGPCTLDSQCRDGVETGGPFAITAAGERATVGASSTPTAPSAIAARPAPSLESAARASIIAALTRAAPTSATGMQEPASTTSTANPCPPASRTTIAQPAT